MDKYASMTWAEVPFIVFDLETTGFGREDRLVEFGAVLMEGNRPKQVLRHLVNPGRPIPAAVTAIHHISDADVVGAPRWRDVAKECFSFLFQGYPIVSHNFSFDSRMLAQQVDPTKWPRDIYTLCTMELARKNGHKGRAKLKDLAEHYNLEYDTEHAAVDDAIVAGKLARRLAGARCVSDFHTKLSGAWADAAAQRL